MTAPAPGPAPLDQRTTRALIERLTAMADDELLLGHRDSEWTGHAPMLEEDIAIANLAQDEIGHAMLWFDLRSGLDGSSPDELAFSRPAASFRSSLLVELPRGDWAFTMIRQFLFDTYEAEALERLESSSFEPLAAAAAKARREELFHLRHSGLWLKRLGLGTAESRRRALAALEEAWPAFVAMLAPLPGDEALVSAGILPRWSDMASSALERARAALLAADLCPPGSLWAGVGTHAGAADGSREAVSSHRIELLSTMQEVALADPGATRW